jgi:hypothetical protein
MRLRLIEHSRHSEGDGSQDHDRERDTKLLVERLTPRGQLPDDHAESLSVVFVVVSVGPTHHRCLDGLCRYPGHLSADQRRSRMRRKGNARVGSLCSLMIRGPRLPEPRAAR